MKIIVTFFLFLGSQLVAKECEDLCYCPTTQISLPCYDGGFYLDGSWNYLRTTATDADLEYGSFLTLTASPANLNALLLEVEPTYQSGYDLGLGYFFCNSNQSVHASYFSLHSSGKDNKEIESQNQFIQNFLGASYSTSSARSEQKVDQAMLSYRFDSVIDQVLNLNLAFGIAYANIRRDFDVEYQDLVLNPNSSQLAGKEESRYWGVGPFIGMEFSFPLLQRLEITGGLETGVLFGKNRSQVSSDSFRNNRGTSFFAKNSSHRTVTNLNCDLGLSYLCPLSCNWGIEFKAGYQVHYYFKPINRINPFNGYVNNSDTFPVDQSSNLGLDGPYVLISLSQVAFPYACDLLSCCQFPDEWTSSGLSFEFTSYWLDPRPTNDDLVFAVLSEIPGQQKNLQADPELTWAGQYSLGYRFCVTTDLRLTAFFFNSSDQASFSAEPGEISSINASGLSDIVFSGALSHVQYKMDQYDGVLGKSIQLCSWMNLHSGVGLRYLKQDRILTNEYLGGTPPLTTREKSPKLKSRFSGLGPLFSLEPRFGPICNLELVGQLGLAFLVGKSKATLDQDNFGILGFSSNDLRTPKTPLVAPVFEGSAGIHWNWNCFSCAQISLEGGYQYMAYYRTVRLLLPTLLTGLEQINSNLILQGPYLRGQISLSF